MFLVAAGFSVLALVFTFLAIRFGERRSVVTRRLPMLKIIQRYHPGMILLVGIAMGIGISIPFSFLRTFAADLGIDNIRVFFLVYAIVAFTTRILCRRLPDRWSPSYNLAGPRLPHDEYALLFDRQGCLVANDSRSDRRPCTCFRIPSSDVRRKSRVSNQISGTGDDLDAHHV